MSVDILPCPTYEGGSVFLNGFSDGPKPYEEVLTFLRKGTDMLKYGRIGAPKSHPFRLSNDMTELQWESKKGQVRRIPLKCICRLEQGQNSSVFKKYPKPESQHVSFSIHYADESKRSRTLDVICNNKHDYEMWYWGVQIIMHYPPTTFYSTPPQALPAARAHALPGTVSAPTVTQHRATPQPATVNTLLASVRTLPSVADRRPKATPKTKPMAVSLDLMKSMRSSGTTMGITQTDTRAQMGDLYAWGSLMVVEADEPSSTPGNPSASHESLRVVMQSNRPNLVGEANCVDVARVSCAPRHAALITRNGELYTWGIGRDGNLGHGWCGNVPKPRLLTRMGGRGVRAVSCGEGASAAISAEQRLFMWGKGTAGQLGNGYAFPCAEPALVVFPGLREDVKVLAVSCGPYHTAAITEGGLLYTWGNGLFGRLGHGSHSSEYRPRRVVELEDKCVIDVSCGYWHTAAVARSRSGTRSRPASLTPSMEFVTPASTPCAQPHPFRHLPTTASAPNMSTGGDGMEDGSRGELSLRIRSRTADMSSSGSDLQGAVAAMAASVNATRPLVRGSYGGGEPSSSNAVPSVGCLRDEVMSCSVASFDKLPDVASEDLSESLPGAAGMLFTWGCDFSWMDGGKRDKHFGCLGLGDDIEGRLVPTRVRGDMDKHGVVQVACGWNMTIALSADGRVYQMGSTGAHTTDKNCTWEGAKVPTRVDGNLFGMFVEEVACGMRHVVAVASKVQANGQIPDDQRRIRLLAWGCGTEGQLGLWGNGASTDASVAVRASPTDHSLPQIVGSLDGRRVLHIAAGGNLTMAVMEHDSRTRRSNPGPSAMPTTTNHFGGSTTSTPSGGGAHSRALSVAQYQSVVGGFATGVRDASSAAAFQISQSLPITVAAAGLQSLQQMVSGGVGSRSKSGTPTAPPDVSFMPRRRPSRVVGIPQPTFGQPRSDTHHRHRSDLRRSTTRLLTSHQGFSGQVVQKALSSGGQEGKMLDATASASSGIVSQRSSPPLGQPSEDADSRSASPTSNSLYEISNVDGDFQPSRHVRSAVLETRTRSNSVDSAVNVASFTTVAAAAVANFARPLPRRGSSGNAADIQSLGDNSTGDTPETDTDSYAHGGRSLDMVPEQSEESPGSPSPISRHSHHAMTTAHSLPHHPMAATIAGGVAGSGGVHPHLHPYNMEAREVSTMAMQVKPPTSVKPRLSRLAQQGPAGTTGTAAVAAASTAMPDGSIGETVRSSVSTMDSSYTAEGSASSELSPSGIVTASPETPAGEMDSVHPAVAGMPALPLPFTLPEAPASPPGPQQHLPFASHLMALTPPSPQQHQQQQPTAISASPLPPAGPPSRHGSLGHVLSPQESLVRAQAAAGGAGAPTPGSFGRNRDAGANMWLQPPLAAAGGAGGHSSFRSEGSMRAYGMLPDSVVPAAVTGGHTAMDMPVGAGHRSAGSRGSRGHSRHASYDSVDLTSRDADGQHGNNAAVGGGGGGGGGGGFDPRAAVFPAYGGASASAPPRSATDSITANLLQQNEQLQKELEALRQQVALFKQAAGLASAGASGTGMLPAGGHAYSASNLSGPPPGQQQQVSAAAAAAAAAAAVAAAAVAVHSSPQAIAGGGGVQPHPGGAGPLPTSFLNDSASGHGAGSSGQPSFSPQGPARSAMLHHTHSAGMSTLPPVGASSPGNSFAAGQMTSRSPQPVDRQASIAGAPPPVSVPPPSHRHKRSSSIDVSSLIATRDGIGPAKEYLAPVPQPAPEPSLPPHHVGERMPSMGWEGTAVGSYTAQPALESLRHAHPGVSLAQTALEEFEECLEDGYEGEEDDDEPEEEGEPAVDESLGPSASIDGLGSVTLAVALPMASQGSLHRQLYVAQQQRPPQLPPPQQQLQSQQGPTNRPSAANAVYTHMSYIEDPHSDSVTSLKDVPVRPISETSYRSSGSGDGSSYTASAVEAPASGLAFPTAVQEADVSLTAAAASAAGGGGGGGPIWRTRRNAFVEWVNTMHHEMSEEVPNGGGGPGGNGGAVPGHGGGAGGAPSAEQLFPTGSSVPLAPVAETLPPEGMQFQYAPGVYITLKPPAQKGDRIQLVKVRFNRKVFTDPSQGQAWWSIHRAILSDLYHVTFDMVNKAPVALPQGLPPLAPGPHQPVPTAIMHVRGMSTDTQGTSAGSTAASASSSLYFSVPAGNSPVHGLAATGNGGCSGSGVPATVAAAVPLGDGRAMWIAGASALAGSGSGDLNANWTDVSYDDTAIMISPAPQPSLGGVGPSMPPRHHRSRSGSRTASGGSSHASASRLGQPQCPESPVLALQQVGTGGTYPGPGATVAAAAHLHHPSHQRTRSGGGTSSMS